MLLSLSEYKTAVGIATTDATRDGALSSILAACDAAIRKACGTVLFDATAITDRVIDLPPQEFFTLPYRPVLLSTLQIWENQAATSADPAGFTSDNLLARYTDWDCRPDDVSGLYSLGGQVRRAKGGLWGAGRFRPADSLASRLTAGRALAKITGTFGFAVVPDDVKQAVALMAGLLYARRTGAPLQSESLSGYSYSLAGPFTATAAIYSPDVYGLLKKYGVGAPVFAGGNG